VVAPDDPRLFAQSWNGTHQGLIPTLSIPDLTVGSAVAIAVPYRAGVPNVDPEVIDSGKMVRPNRPSLTARETIQMPRKPGRPKPPGRKAKRVRPSARPRFTEEPAVIRVRLAAAGESLKILSGTAAALSTIELARRINELTDRSIGQVHAACHDGHRVACRSGCTYCCMFPVAASAPEVLAIATFVHERFDEGRQAALNARVMANIAATDGMDMSQRDRVRLDCPFLEAGECKVYEVRPIACRGYSSYSAEDCREDYEHPGTGVEIQTNGLRELVFGAIREGLAVACKSASVEHRLLELVRAYKIAAADSTLAESWRSRPEAFETATGARLFPGPWSDELDQELEVVYRKTVERLESRMKAGYSWASRARRWL
jgi:Fe-S-cluster containining protein